MTKFAVLALAAAALIVATGAARADTCETFPGSQVYTDQGCDKPYDNSAKQNAPAAQTAPKPGTSLRDMLRKALSGGDSGTNARSGNGPSADQLDQRIKDARARVDASLADPNAPGAQDRYNAAMKDLHAAYGDAEKAFPDQADTIRNSESQDAAAASQRAANAGWNAPAPAAADAAPAQPAGPNNVTAIGSAVYVCDGAIAGANNVSCREISADGKQCTGVTLADGGIGWRDSIATPCQDGDMSQRNAFLANNPDAAAAARNAPPGFAMDPDETAAEIKRLTGAPPARPVDPSEESDFKDAVADEPAAPSVEDARAETPMDPSTFASNDNDEDGSSDLDDAIDMLNAASSMLGAASAIAGASAPAIHNIPAPVLRAPSSSYPRATSCNYSGCQTTGGGNNNNNYRGTITGGN